MKFTKLILLSGLFASLLLAGSCKKYSEDEETEEDDEETVVDEETGNESSHEESGDYTWDGASATGIILNTTSITVSGSGASASGTTATISAAGTYLVSGTLTNGKLIVDTEDADAVKVVLNGATITCSDYAPISVASAEKVIVILADGTTNTLTDGSSYTLASGEDEPNAALFSKADLSVSGNGSLVIDANYNDGIASKDGLIIASGTISINAVDDGIRGKDYLIVESGTIGITAGGDGLKSDNDEDDTKGYISVVSGTITVTSTNDALQAETDLLIADGTFKLTSGGGSSKTVSSTESAKALKSGVTTVIDGGTFTISAADDAIHTDGEATINSGTFAISTADDAIHAESTANVNGGTITISKCYEGIESATINITDGDITITSSDDAINASKGSGGESNDGSLLKISGGYLAMYCTGDGLDSNGSITVTGGTIIEHGPTSSPEVAMDYNGTCLFNGGTIALASINSSMNQTPSTTSTQNTVQIRFSSSQSANSIFRIQDASGNEIVTLKPSKTYSAITFSSSGLAKGSTYYVYTGGSYSGGTSTGGLLSGGTYSGGTQYTNFSVSSSVTTVGTASGR
ncbi:MAG: carbohydrate-binding domain-containing protein [Mangrovibacterium sp.]